MSGQNENIELDCVDSGVKFNIWDVVSAVCFIIMLSDEIDSLGLFTAGLKPLYGYNHRRRLYVSGSGAEGAEKCRYVDGVE